MMTASISARRVALDAALSDSEKEREDIEEERSSEQTEDEEEDAEEENGEEFEKLQKKLFSGWAFGATKITEKFTYNDFLQKNKEPSSL